MGEDIWNFSEQTEFVMSKNRCNPHHCDDYFYFI